MNSLTVDLLFNVKCLEYCGCQESYYMQIREERKMLQSMDYLKLLSDVKQTLKSIVKSVGENSLTNAANYNSFFTILASSLNTSM